MNLGMGARVASRGPNAISAVTTGSITALASNDPESSGAPLKPQWVATGSGSRSQYIHGAAMTTASAMEGTTYSNRRRHELPAVVLMESGVVMVEPFGEHGC